MKILYLFLLTVFAFHSSAYSQIPKGDRTLAWAVESAENDDYNMAFDYAQAGCMESIHLAVTWSGIEPDAGIFDATFMAATLDAANIYYSLNDVKLELQIAVTNTVSKEVPTDLMTTDFSDPTLITRFKTLLDTVFAHIPDVEISSLNIGNESDILFGVDEDQYAAFKTFLDAVAPYAKSRYNTLYGTDIEVGTTLTLYGTINPAQTALCHSLNENMDIISITYYPLNNDFTMRSPAAVETDFDDLVAAYPDADKPIHFAECGYSSSEVCNSSEELQAQFYSEVFRVWDKHYANIKYISIFKLTDWSHATVEYLSTYYGIDDPIFLEYLRALGVRTWDGDGTNKLAYEYILCELEARDWCAVDCALAGLDESQSSSTEFLTVFPNPVQSQLSILCREEIDQVKIYTLTGELLTTSNKATINVNQLPASTYLLQIELKNGSINFLRFIKE